MGCKIIFFTERVIKLSFYTTGYKIIFLHNGL